MEHVAVARPHVRELDVRRLAQTGRIPFGPLDTVVVPVMDVLQFRAQDSRVDVVETAVEAEAVNVALVRAMVPQLPDCRVDRRVIRDEGAAVAKRAEVLL